MARHKQSKSSNVDPFEAAKVSASALGMPELVDTTPVFAPDPFETSAPEPVAAPAPAPVPDAKALRALAAEEEARVRVAAAQPRPKKYLVTRRTTVMWRGQMITLQADDDVSESFYGAGSVEYFRKLGVGITEVADTRLVPV